MGYGTHHANVCKELREYPDTWRHNDDGNHVEDESYDRKPKEGTDEAEHPHADVPHAETHDGWPKWEHDSSEHNGYHEQTTGICRPLGSLVEPCKVAVLRKRLLWSDSDVTGRG